MKDGMQLESGFEIQPLMQRFTHPLAALKDKTKSIRKSKRNIVLKLIQLGFIKNKEINKFNLIGVFKKCIS